MKKVLISILSLTLLLSACSKENKKENIESITLESSDTNEESKITKEDDKNKFDITIYDYFDTVTNFTAYTEDEEKFNFYKKIIDEKMQYYHQLFNSYEEFKGVNNVYTINKMAGKEAVKVEKPVIDLIKIGKKWNENTKGKINIGAGSLLKIWTDFRNNANKEPEIAKLPSKNQLEEAKKHIDISAIEINEKDSTVYIKDKDVQIDIGAIGKGYATELIKNELIKNGLKQGILSVGGDVAIIGKNPKRENEKYTIAIQSPDQENQNTYASIVYVTDTSVVTSGDYERYFEINGRKYHHIIDTQTLEPSTRYKSISVILDDIGIADALSTALFVMDRKEGEELAKKFNAEVFWIDTENNQYKTKGFEKYEEK